MQASFDFRGLRCFASPNDAGMWRYLPRRPDLQRGADGRPLLTMIDMGTAGYLLFTARWAAPPEDLEALRRELAAREGPGRATLSFAPVSSLRCNALIGDGSGAYRTVATSGTSGIPPYDAAFNLFLEDDRLAHAKAALRGERGYLGIEYLADLRMPVSAKATFHARAMDLLAALQGSGADASRLRELLERAVQTGAAVVTIDAPDPHASELAAELYDRVLARAAELLPPLLRQGAPGDIDITAALDKEVPQPTCAFADVGALISARALESDIGGQDAAD
jgi:hypothetical protein